MDNNDDGNTTETAAAEGHVEDQQQQLQQQPTPMTVVASGSPSWSLERKIEMRKEKRKREERRKEGKTRKERKEKANEPKVSFSDVKEVEKKNFFFLFPAKWALFVCIFLETQENLPSFPIFSFCFFTMPFLPPPPFVVATTHIRDPFVSFLASAAFSVSLFLSFFLCSPCCLSPSVPAPEVFFEFPCFCIGGVLNPTPFWAYSVNWLLAKLVPFSTSEVMSPSRSANFYKREISRNQFPSITILLPLLLL